MSWRIVYTDGTEEITPVEVDKVTSGLMANSQFLYCYAKMNYGPDELVRTYFLPNIRYWEKIK